MTTPEHIVVHIDDLEHHAGSELGISSWRVVSQDTVDAFARVTDDEQWIHTEPLKAASGPFRGAVVHGHLTLALLPSFLREVVVFEGVSMSVNYGINGVRFIQPVLVGASIRDRINVTSVERTGDRTRIAVTHSIELIGQERPACVAETISLLVHATAHTQGEADG